MHFPVTPFAYQGFKPWADIVPPANKPGETNESRANKFQNVGHGVVYRKGPPCEFPRDSTNFSMSYTNVEPADFVVRGECRISLPLQFLFSLPPPPPPYSSSFV